MSKNALGTRMKDQYEFRARTLLPRRTYTIIRCDGRAFHTYTRTCEKPFDAGIIDAMTDAAHALVMEVQGARLAYIQSDEISLLLTDFDTIHTQAWLDGAVQKQCSLAASIVTAAFNRVHHNGRDAHFDARTFTIPDAIEVENYFIWRQQDAIRNSISSLARSHFSHKDLAHLDGKQMQDKLWREKQVNWNDLADHLKRGHVIWRKPVTALRRDFIPLEHHARYSAAVLDELVDTSQWTQLGAPWFTQDRQWLTRQVQGPQEADWLARQDSA